jgi:hypothetical protein
MDASHGNPFDTFCARNEKGWQELKDTRDGKRRAHRLRNVLWKVLHPSESPKEETNSPALWTPEAWAQRFIAAAAQARKDGLQCVLDDVATAAQTDQHRIGIELWRLAFAENQSELLRRLTQLLPAEPAREPELKNRRWTRILPRELQAIQQHSWILALCDVNDWLSKYVAPGECFYFCPAATESSTAAQTRRHKGAAVRGKIGLSAANGQRALQLPSPTSQSRITSAWPALERLWYWASAAPPDAKTFPSGEKDSDVTRSSSPVISAFRVQVEVFQRRILLS